MDLTPTDTPLEELPEYPIWRQATLEAVATFSYGDVISHDWLDAHLEIEIPDGPISAEKHRELAFDRLEKVEGFKDTMLREHQRYLVSARGLGYQIIAPENQTSVAMDRAAADIRRGVRQAMKALVNIDATRLGLEQAKENSEAKCKIAWFNTVGVKALEKDTPRLPSH